MGNGLYVPLPDFLNQPSGPGVPAAKPEDIASGKVVPKGPVDRSPLSAIWKDTKGLVGWVGDRIKGGQDILNNLTNPLTLGIVVVGAIVVLKVISK